MISLPPPVRDRSGAPPEGEGPALPWSFRLVTDFRDLQALAPAWDALLEQCASSEPMLAPDWLLTWWRVYGEGSGRELRVGLLYEGERLVGLAPLCRRRVWYRPGIPFTRLELLGADVDEQDGVCSAYLDLLAPAGREELVTGAFVAEIRKGSFGSWQEVVFDAVNGANGSPERLRSAFASAGYHATTETITEAPYLTLPASWEACSKSMPRKHRHDVTRALRHFEAWAGNDWKLEVARTPTELARGQQLLETLHHERWKEGAGQEGAFASPRFAAFHHAYVPRLFAAGKLELLWLTVHGEPIMANYQIVANHKVYYYLCGRSLHVPPDVRPGVLMTAFALQRAIEAGLSEFDFLRGRAQYKSEFTHTARPIVQVRVARAGVREWLHHNTEIAIGFVRRLRNRRHGLNAHDRQSVPHASSFNNHHVSDRRPTPKANQDRPR